MNPKYTPAELERLSSGLMAFAIIDRMLKTAFPTEPPSTDEFARWAVDPEHVEHVYAAVLAGVLMLDIFKKKMVVMEVETDKADKSTDDIANEHVAALEALLKGRNN